MFLLYLFVAMLIGALLVAGEFVGDAEAVFGRPAYAFRLHSAVDCLTGAPQTHGLTPALSLLGDMTANSSTHDAKVASHCFPRSDHTAAIAGE